MDALVYLADENLKSYTEKKNHSLGRIEKNF